MAVDGSVFYGGRTVACGGIFRNDKGNWIVGFMLKIGSSAVLMVELLGVVTALEFAREEGFRHLLLECDSITAVQLIQKGCKQSRPYHHLLIVE